MNLYFMQGADGVWYGPVDLDCLRDWVREERVVVDTLVRVEGGGEVAAGTLPELRGAFQLDGVLVAGDVFRKSWKVFKARFGAVYGGCFLLMGVLLLLELIPKVIVLALSGVVPDTNLLVTGTGMIGALFQLVLTGPLMVGFYKYLLRLVDGGTVEFGDLLEGFRLLAPSVLLQWLKAGLLVGMLLLLMVPWALLAQNEVQGIQPGDPTWIVRSPITLLWVLVLAIAFTAVTTLWWLAEPMLADHTARSAWEALWQSTQRVLRQLKPVVVYFTWATVLFVLGLLPLGLGLLVVMPYLAVTSAQLYRDMVPKISGEEP